MRANAASALAFVVANLINAEFGYYGFVYGLLALYAITGIGIAWLPANFLGNTAAQAGGVAVAGFNLSAALAIFGLVCSFGAYTAVWSFAAVIGINNGFSEETVNNILLFALLAISIVYVVGRIQYDIFTGICAAVLLGLFPAFWLYTAHLLTEMPFLALFSGAVFFLYFGFKIVKYNLIF